MAGDVFEKHPGGFDRADDAGNIGPEVTLVVGPFALPGHAERLAGVAGKDGVDRAPEGPPVKGGEVIPYRGGGEVSGALCGDEDASGVFLPFDKAAGVEARFGQHEAHIQASAARAEGKSVSGTWHHAIHAPTIAVPISAPASPQASMAAA